MLTSIPRPSVAENNVAIIVGSLPAFSHFIRTHATQTAFFKVLSSKLSFNSKSHATDAETNEPSQKQTLWTIGSPQKRKPQYYELTDTATLKTHVSVPEGAIVKPLETGSGILRTMGYSQEVHTLQSAERLV